MDNMMSDLLEFFGRIGRYLAESVGITERFPNEESYAAFGMSIFIIGFLVFFGLLILKKTIKNRNAFASFAKANGYVYEPKSNKDLMSINLFSAPFLQKGRWRGVKNIFRGTLNGDTFVLFEYWYTYSDMPQRFLVAAFPLAKDNLPEFGLSAKLIHRNIPKNSDYSEICFTDDPVFSKSYLLFSPEKSATATRSFFDHKTRSLLKNQEILERGGMECFSSWLIVYETTTDSIGVSHKKHVKNMERCLDKSLAVMNIFRGL
jgi:hypothetical protein